MMKRKSGSAEEKDVVSRWRRVLCYMGRAGVTHRIKRRMRRRERHDARADLHMAANHPPQAGER